MQQFTNWLSSIVISPTKSLVTTLSSAATGSLIEFKMNLLQVPASSNMLEVWLRNGAWLMSMIVGLCTVINFIDTQLKKNKKPKKK